jgi:two-component system sensor histidine kinase KdpD
LQHQGEVVFQVTDRGKGMLAQHKLQGDESRGLGIGLQLCHAVAQVHAGRLNFSTSAIAGQGVLAIFTLPLSVVQAQGA